MLAVTCLQHWYQGRFEAHHSIFELKGSPQQSEGEEDNYRLTSANDYLLSASANYEPGLMPAPTPLPAAEPFEGFIATLPTVVLSLSHSPPVKPPTLLNS